MNDLKSKGIQAFVWDILGKLGTKASSLIVTIFLARLLEPSDFGMIAIIMVIVSIATIFSDVGLGGALIQRRRALQIHYSSVFIFNIIAGLALTLLTFFSASWIASFFNNPQLIPLIQVMSFLFSLSALHAVQSVLLRKELNYKLLTKVDLIASITSGIIGIILAILGAGVWSLVAQLLSREIIINIVIWSKTTWIPTLAFSFKALRQLWSYGLHMFLAGLLDTIFERLDYIIIGRLFTPSTLGFFHQAKQLNMFVIQFSSGSLMSVLFPVLSKIQKDIKKFRRVIVKSTGIICFVAFFLLGELYLVADELIILLFGEKWASSSFYFKILALSGFAYPISALMVSVLKGRGKSKDFLRLEVYKKVIQSVNLYVLYAFGINAFLYGLIVTSLLATSLNILFATREIGLTFMSIARPVLIQALLCITIVLSILLIVKNIQLSNFPMMVLKGVLFLMVYMLSNWLFKIKSFKFVQEQFVPMFEKIKKRRGQAGT